MTAKNRSPARTKCRNLQIRPPVVPPPILASVQLRRVCRPSTPARPDMPHRYDRTHLSLERSPRARKIRKARLEYESEPGRRPGNRNPVPMQHLVVDEMLEDQALQNGEHQALQRQIHTCKVCGRAGAGAVPCAHRAWGSTHDCAAIVHLGGQLTRSNNVPC